MVLSSISGDTAKPWVAAILSVLGVYVLYRFLVSLSWRQVPVSQVLLLLAGGLIDAPLAAWLVRRIAPRKLGVIVGAAIPLTNTRTLAGTFGIDGAWRAALYLAIVAVVGALAAWRLTQSRQRRRARAAVVATRHAPAPEPVGA